MEFDLWLAFVAASTVLLLIPGPTVLLILSYAFSQGKQVAGASAVGAAIGDFIAMSASLAGLGALVMASATLFSILKWVGAAYLIWTGIKFLRTARQSALALPETTQQISALAVMRHTAMVTALNPKPIVFFIAFVPQFLRPEQALTPQFTVLIATFVGLAFLNALAYAVLAGQMRRLISRPSFLAGLTRMGGVGLIGMGLLTASIQRATP